MTAPGPAASGAGQSGGAGRLRSAGNGLLICVGVSLFLWRLGAAVLQLGGDGTMWWHARMAGDMQTVNARVTAHDLREYSGDGSWGHKGSLATRKNWHYALPVVELEYAPTAGAPAIRSTRAISESFEANDKARAYLSTRLPVGSTTTVLVSAGQPERFLFSVDEAPSTTGLLWRLLTSLAMLVFIELPIIVLFTLFVLPSLGSLLAWPVRQLVGTGRG